MKALILLALLVLVGAFLVFPFQKQKTQQQNNPLDKPEAIASQLQESEVHSPDGTMKLIMRDHSFFVSDISGKNQKTLFTKIASLEEEMFIPRNSFSPDNKYVYLEENRNGSLNALVFKTTGLPFSGGEEYLDVSELLAKNKKGYLINHITGWVSPTLIQINTLKDSLTRGPSFWFSVETRAFLSL